MFRFCFGGGADTLCGEKVVNFAVNHDLRLMFAGNLEVQVTTDLAILGSGR